MIDHPNSPLVVEFRECDDLPGIYTVLFRFRAGWQSMHYRRAWERAWEIMLENLPEDAPCYALCHFEAQPRLDQPGLLAELVRVLRHPIVRRFTFTYVVGLDKYVSALAVRLEGVAEQLTGVHLPFALCDTLPHAFEMMRDHATQADSI